MGGDLKSVVACSKWDAVLRRLLGQALSFLAAREVAFFARHDSAWVVDVEESERNQHGERVEAVLIRFVVGDCAIEAVGVLDQSEDDTELPMSRTH